jgi:hypothetical protein
LHSELHKLIMLLEQRRIVSRVERVNCRTYSQKGDKIDCSNYRGMSLLSTSYNILYNIFLSRLIPYADEIIGDHQCGFQRNRQRLIRFSISFRYWKKVGVQWHSTSAIYKFQESL